MSTILIRSGRVITADDDRPADVFIEDGRIAAVGPDIHRPADRVLEAAGRYVIPGGIDVHTHMDLPVGGAVSSDDFETGTIAAAHGGTTTIIDFANQYRGQTLRQALDAWLARAEGKVVIDYGLHAVITDLTEAVAAEMGTLVREGISTFKLFMAYPGTFMSDDGTIFRALRWTRENGGLVLLHAENGFVIDELVKRALAEGQTAPKYHPLTRPVEAEAEAVRRAISLAEMAEAPVYIVHLTTADGMAAIRAARDRGRPVLAETCPQYLFLSSDRYEEPGFEGAKYVMSPPLRPRYHQEALWTGLASGGVQVVATDHCPFIMKEGYAGLPKQKELGIGDFTKIPNGAPGVEPRLPLIHDGGVRSGRMSLRRWVEVCCAAPARIMGLFPRKGTIAAGSDADIVIFDPEREMSLSWKNLHMRVDYSLYEEMTVRGWPTQVLSRGEVIVDDGRFTGRRGAGRFLKRGLPQP